jgi:DNA-binding NarL/FixJ family response regulator
MERNRALALIVVRSGPLRDGLEALMATVSRIEIVDKGESAPAALSLVHSCRPDLLLLDAGLSGDESCNLLIECQRAHPGLRCIVLADDAEQVREARVAGADAVFLKGFPADKFVRTVERLVFDRKAYTDRDSSY